MKISKLLLAILLLSSNAMALSAGARMVVLNSGPLSTKQSFDRYVIASKPTLFTDPGLARSVTSNSTRQVSAIASRYGTHTLTQGTSGNKPLLSRADNKENLFLNSEDLSTTWSTTNASISTNQIANPLDASTTADLLTENGSAGTHRVFQTAVTSVFSGISYRVSFYAKANGRTRLRVYFDAPSAEFNLTAVTATSFGATTSSSIAAIGANGWYRCTFEAPAASTGALTTSFYLHDAGNNESYTGDSVSGMYIWGAQLSEAAADTAYLSTTDHQQYRGVNGYQALVFDGTDDVMTSTATQSNVIANNAMTQFLVFRGTKASSGGQIFGGLNGFQIYSASSTNWRFTNHDGTSDTVDAAQTAGTVYVAETRHDSGSIYNKLNNGSEASTASGNTSNLTDTLLLGAGSSAGANPFAGKILEVLTFNTALPIAVRQTLNQGLSKF